jgi:hypothetical protein
VAVAGLDRELMQPADRLLVLLGVAEHVGRHRSHQWLLREVEADEVLDVA